jgi:hypothetical protein
MSILSLDGMSFSGVAWTFKFQQANTQKFSMWHAVLKASVWSLRTVRFNIYRIVHSAYAVTRTLMLMMRSKFLCIYC